METNSHIHYTKMPLHKPNADLWDSIETELDLQPITGNIDELPVHHPEQKLWNSINTRLNFNKYAGYTFYSLITITSLVLLFVFLNKTSTKNESNPEQHASVNLKLKENTENTVVASQAPAAEKQNLVIQTEKTVNSLKTFNNTNPANTENISNSTKKAKIVKTPSEKTVIQHSFKGKGAQTTIALNNEIQPTKKEVKILNLK